eukprot:6079406-Amphidinium_carterae.1
MLCLELQPETEVINSLLHSKEGPQQVLAHTFHRSVYWKSKERRCRELCVATKSLKPEVTAAERRVHNMGMEELVGKILPRMRTWQEGLLPGLWHVVSISPKEVCFSHVLQKVRLSGCVFVLGTWPCCGGLVKEFVAA